MNNLIKIQHNSEDLPKKCVIYVIENLLTGDKYVGQTSRTMLERLKQHLYQHSKNKSSECNDRTLLYKDAEEIGWENFRLTILAENVTDKKMRTDYFEKYCQGKLEFLRYSERDRNRDTSKKYSQYISATNGKVKKVFESFKKANEYFSKLYQKDFHRTALIKSVKGKYKFLKKWEIKRISPNEYYKETGQLNLDFKK